MDLKKPTSEMEIGKVLKFLKEECASEEACEIVRRLTFQRDMLLARMTRIAKLFDSVQQAINAFDDMEREEDDKDA